MRLLLLKRIPEPKHQRYLTYLGMIFLKARILSKFSLTVYVRQTKNSI